MQKKKKYAIEKGVPMPPVARKSKYPFAIMEVGDSFFSPHRNVGATTSAAAKRLGRTFTVRNVDGGYRVWRTK